MGALDQPPARLSGQLAQVCGAFSCAMALLSLAGRLGGWQFLAGLGTHYGPIAPSSALGAAVLGAGLLVRARWPVSQPGRRFAASMAVLACGLAGLHFGAYPDSFDSYLRRLAAQAPEFLRDILVGRMSAIAAATLLVAAAALLALLFRPAGRAAPILATGVTAVGFVALLGYAYGTPLLYGGTRIRTALPLAAVLSVLGVGLAAASDPGAWPLRLVLGPSVRARLVRVFLPAVLAVVVGSGWLVTALLPYFKANPTLGVSLAAVLSLTFGGATVTVLARNIGGELDRAERELRRVNRALLAVRDCTHALAHADSEPELLREVCRIAVERGGYRMAWVGYAEHDEAKTVRPVAQAGCEEGYLESIGLTWAETGRGSGPTGLVIRTGQPFLAREIVKEPSLIYWRANVLQRGHASALTLPLVADGKTYGALSIYSDESNAFDAEEMSLLTELANDLAFGIDVLRTRGERRRADEAIRKYETIFQLAGWGMIIADPDTHVITHANLAFARMHGYAVEEVIGMNLADTFAPESLAELPAGIRQVYAKGRHTYESVRLRKDGSRFPCRADVTAVTDATGGILFYAATLEDITERKRAEEKLRASEERFRRTFQHSAAGMVLVSPDSRFLQVNDSFRKMLGYTESELLERSFQDVTLPEDRPVGGELTRRVLSGEMEMFQIEKRYLHKDGSVVWGLVSSTLIRDTQNRPLHFVSQIQDITERKRAEEHVRLLNEDLQRYAGELEQRVAERTAELASAKERAESADRMKSAFLASMSHELRTPLNSIIGFTGIVLQGLVGPLTAEQTKQLAFVKGSALHLLALINDVLDISKIEAGQVEMVRAPFDLGEAIRRAAQTVAPLAGKKQLRLAVQVAPEVGRIDSDRRRVEQILLNLLNNAIKFTDRGQVRVECNLGDGVIVTRVTDTGIGIQPDDLGKLFQPFRQLDGGTARLYEGTGLGLAICKRLVEQLGGTISVESEWSAGSTFQFTLPAGPERRP
ncbi:MAG: PAS domain S-box protein [Acidobacteria bacterium]|nr:PAS domain S-box protein [Acidobacteriota bacterium]